MLYRPIAIELYNSFVVTKSYYRSTNSALVIVKGNGMVEVKFPNPLIRGPPSTKISGTDARITGLKRNLSEGNSYIKVAVAFAFRPNK